MQQMMQQMMLQQAQSTMGQKGMGQKRTQGDDDDGNETEQVQPKKGKTEAKASSDDDLTIPTSVTYMFQLPLKRQQHGIEWVNEEFDSIATGTWETPILMRLLWLLTGVQPNLQVAYIYIYVYIHTYIYVVIVDSFLFHGAWNWPSPYGCAACW